MYMKEQWVPVLKSSDIAAGDLVPLEVDGIALLIVADLDGKIFAIANSCPHLGTPLENGRLESYTSYLSINMNMFMQSWRRINNCMPIAQECFQS
jgi:nitrite reductase/ring-hydroxylating ferredoxin subunit